MNGLGIVGCVVGLGLSVATARASVYSAAGNTLPGAPFQRFDAAHPASTTSFSPYFGLGFTPSSPDHSVAGGVYSSGQTDQGKYTFWLDGSQTLNSMPGVDITARLRVTASSSISVNRAGVAIGMTDNANNYTEVYLGTTEIFINGPGRVRSATYTMDTSSAFHDYLVRVQGTSVSVFVDGLLRLSGNSFFASIGTAPTLPNWAALGDITQSAAGAYELQWFAVAVPEPAGIALLAVAGMVATARRRR